MSKERDILKSLLLKEELELLEEIKQKFLSQKQFTKEVSNVLSGAIVRAQKKDKELERALSKPVNKGVKRIFSQNKQSIIDALLPIMGQLIRKTVTNSIKRFVADINRTLELGFSSKAIKWRWQAYKAGIPFAEIVFQKTTHYQVKELFVINRVNGLLIEHVGSNDMLKDKNAISAMLTAIQDFIGDSLQSSEEGLLSAEIGDHLILISTGPKAYMASVVKGSPTERLKEKSQQLIENIHADFSDLLVDESQYQNTPEFDEYLRLHLITKSISERNKNINWLPWIIILTLIVSSLAYWSYQRRQQYNNIIDIAQSIPGFFLQSVKRNASGFEIAGLLDPLADTLALQNKNIILTTKPFISLNSAIIQKRVLKIIAPYPAINIDIQEYNLIVSGEVTSIDSQRIIEQLNNVNGINEVVNNLTIDSSKAIKSFVKKYKEFQNSIEYIVSTKTLLLSGDIDYQNFELFKSQLYRSFPNIIIDNSAVNIIDSTAKLISGINKTTINIPKLEHHDEETKKQLEKVIKSSQSIIKRKGKMLLVIIGESDCHGKNSDEYSNYRAETIKQAFLLNRIDEKLLTTKIIPCLSFNNKVEQLQKNVSFKIE